MRMTLRSDSTTPPSQPLLKLPLLVQVEVIKSMTPNEQYLLSKCSRRTRQAVKASIPDKKPVREIWIKFYRGSLRKSSDHDKRDTVCFLMKIGKNMLLIRESRGEFSPEEHAYICDLFNVSSDVYASWDGAQLNFKIAINRSIKRSNLLEENWGHKSMIEYSELHPNQDLVLLRGFHTNSLRSGHSFLESRNLMISDTKMYCVYIILSLFQGDHLLMEDVQIDSFFIRTFVDKWVKKSNDRMRTVILQLNPKAVIGNLKYEKFSGSDRKFQYDSLIKDYHKLPNGIFDCTNGYIIKRETDGKLATIKITRDYFMFLVW